MALKVPFSKASVASAGMQSAHINCLDEPKFTAISQLYLIFLLHMACIKANIGMTDGFIFSHPNYSLY